MKFKTYKLAACALAAMTTLLSPGKAEAIFASVKSTGMAATAVSYPQDTLVGAYNPAGISVIGNRIDGEAGWDQTRQHTTISGNLAGGGAANGFYDGGKTKDFYIANFGITKNLRYNLTAGLILYNRNFLKTTYGRPNILLGTSPAGLEYLHEVIAPMVAIRICNDHSLGVALNVNVQRFKVNGLQNFDTVLFSTNPGFVTNNGYNWSSGVGVTIGWLSRFWCDRIGVGVAYTPYGQMSKFRKYRGLLAHEGKFNLPQRWNAGISFRWIPKSTIAFDIEWVNWNQIKALSNPLAESFILQPLGGPDGTGFGFKNQLFYRVGIDYEVNNCFTVRAGFRHVNVPFSSSQTAVNTLTLDTVENFATCGFTWAWRCFEFSGLYAHGFHKRVNGSGSIPLLLGGGEADLVQEKDILAIAAGYKF